MPAVSTASPQCFHQVSPEPNRRPTRAESPSGRNNPATAAKREVPYGRTGSRQRRRAVIPLDHSRGGPSLRRALKYIIGGAIGAAVPAVLIVGEAYADTGDDALAAVTQLGAATNLLWVVIGAVLVIFMQAGFALVETGFTQKKNAAHVMSTNFAIFGLGFVGFLFVGFPLAFGGFSYGAFGLDTPMNGDGLPADRRRRTAASCTGATSHLGNAATPALLGFFLYMVAFMDTVATIPTGAMAERWKWKSFAQWGLFCGALYYPLFAAWTWGGGWLAKTLEQHAPRCRLRRLRRLRRGARRRWRRRPRRSDRARAAHRQVRRRTASRTRSRRTTSRWPSSAASSCCSAGSASTPHRRSPPPTCSSPTVAANTAIAGAVGATVAMYYMIWQDRQARPGDDGQRHARRPGGDHRPVRVRRPVGGGRHRPASRRSS